MSYFCHDTKETPRNYKEYLQTVHWQNIRAAVIEATAGVCQCCKRKNMRLNVHHKHYKTLGRETFADLAIFCETCHMRHHAGGQVANARHASVGHSFKGVLLPLCMWETRYMPETYKGFKFASSKRKITCPTCRDRFSRYVRKQNATGHLALSPQRTSIKRLVLGKNKP